MNMKIIIGLILLASVIGLLAWRIQMHNTNRIPEDGQISITAFCDGKNPCQFTGQDLNLSLQISNTSDQAISLPLQFLQQRGPSIRLINRQTGQDLVLPTNPANADLMQNYQTIQPGEYANLDWIITSAEIEQLANAAAEINAEITVSTPVKSGADIKEAVAATELLIKI